MGVPGIVVGAFARDLHLHYGAGIPIQRGTEDIDFAFTVNSWSTVGQNSKRYDRGLLSPKVFEPSKQSSID
jgi:predicted nucleotidyltransferase